MKRAGLMFAIWICMAIGMLVGHYYDNGVFSDVIDKWFIVSISFIALWVIIGNWNNDNK